MVKASRFLRTAIITFILLIFFSCYGSWNFLFEGNNVDERTKSLKMLTDANNKKFAASGISSLSGKYTVLVISDTHFGNKKKDIDCKPFFEWLEKLKGKPDYPVFAISLGDVVDSGKQE